MKRLEVVRNRWARDSPEERKFKQRLKPFFFKSTETPQPPSARYIKGDEENVVFDAALLQNPEEEPLRTPTKVKPTPPVPALHVPVEQPHVRFVEEQVQTVPQKLTVEPAPPPAHPQPILKKKKAVP